MKPLEAYAANEKQALEHRAINDHVDIVRRVASYLSSRLPDCVQVDDLVQAGMLGLLEASRRFDPSRGTSFRTFAERRVRGAMLDELRRGDWVPRSVHRNAREVAEAIRSVEQDAGIEASDQAVADRLGVSLAEYHRTLQDIAGQRLLSFEVLSDGDDEGRRNSFVAPGQTPEATLAQGQDRQRLAAAVGELPDRERLVLSLYYHEELNLKEIGAILEVGESRVSQIRSQALLRLRARLAP